MRVLLLAHDRQKVRMTRQLLEYGKNVYSLECNIVPAWCIGKPFKEFMEGLEVVYGDRYSLAGGVRETQDR